MPNSPGTDAQPQPAPVPEAGDPSAELERIEDLYKRALADLDNYRKRAAREVESRVAAVREAVIGDWLEVVDTVERAIAMQPDGPCSEGLRAVLHQMNAVLAREGAERVGAAGDRFDPERHEAIAVRDTAEVSDPTVLSVERSGFALGDRVIRPAQVVVARPPSAG